MKRKLTGILNVIVNILVVIILIFSAFILVVSLTSKTENGGIPNVFGKAPISVLTDSMKGDAPDDFNAGDLIICDVVPDDGSRMESSYKEGDIVTFTQDLNGDNILEYVTHRIYKVNKDGTYLTKGDNNPTYDQDENNATVFGAISNTDVLAVYTGTKISGLGNVLSYLQTSMGFFLCVLLPMIIFFLYEAVRVVINIVAYNKEKAFNEAQKAIDASTELTEEQKQRAIEEYLAAQNGKSPGEPSETPADDPADDPADVPADEPEASDET